MLSEIVEFQAASLKSSAKYRYRYKYKNLNKTLIGFVAPLLFLLLLRLRLKDYLSLSRR